MARQILAKEKNEKKIKEKALALIEKGGWDNSCLGAMLLRHSGKSTSNSEFSAVVCKMADSELWYVRETAASLLKDLLLNDFDYFFGLLKKMVKDKNPNIRRAAVVGSMQSKLSEKQAVKVAQLIYRPLLNDENVYVRKNLGSFAVSQFLRLYPKAGLAFFDREMKKMRPWPVWNILNAFQSARLRANRSLIIEAKKYLGMTAGSQDKNIRGAAVALERRLNAL